MSSKVVQVRGDAVEPVAVIPLLHRLRGLNVALLKPHIDWRFEVKCPGAPLCSKFHFVVGIGTSRVEDNRFTCFHIYSHIVLPEVPVNQHWLYLTTFRLSRPSDCRAPRSIGITTSISCLQAASYSGQGPFVSLSYLITSSNCRAKAFAQLLSQVTVRSNFPRTAGTGNPNIPLGDVPLWWSSAIWDIRYSALGVTARFIS